jgi:hypothetical protein
VELSKKVKRKYFPPIKNDLGSILHEKRKAVKEKSKRKESQGNAKQTGVKEETPARRNGRERQGN